tara:strand:- start:89 stop:394 length:306 start_codon:yes stop_codon:yes gene_type:complete
MSVKLALMCKSHNYQAQPNGEFRLGNWRIADSRRQELLGQQVVLTESQKTPAYMGGTIIGFAPTQNGKKCEVIFQEDNTLTGNTDAISHRGWGVSRGHCYI